MGAPGTRRIAYAVAAVAAVVVVVVVVVLLMGGGDDDVNNNADRYEGTQAEVAAVVDEFANAGRDGDGTKVCEDIFTADLAQNVERESGQSCPSEVQENLPEDEYELEVDTLEVDGDIATVAVTDQEDNSSVLHITKVDAAWRIARVTPGS
jgi:hypothetical protein